MFKPKNSAEVLAYLLKSSPRRTVLLAFSRGKDSIGAWLALRDAGFSVIPFHMYMVPGLEFVDRSLAYYEKFFDTEIKQYPHPSLYRWLNNYTFQAPQNCRHIEAAQLPDFDYDDLHRVIKEDHHLPLDTWVCSGVRQNDSLNRRTAFTRYGALNHKRRMAYPIYDWSSDQLYEAIAAAGVSLPIDYMLFGKSLDGIDYRYLAPLRDKYPQDYARILEYFPLAELEIKRHEYAQKNANL